MRKKYPAKHCNLLSFLCLGLGIVLVWSLVFLDFAETSFPTLAPSEKNVALSCREITEPMVSKLNGPVRPATVAYSLSVHHRFDHLLGWMDEMYEAQNFYIIHVDAKATKEFWEQVNAWSSRYPNIKVNQNRYSVVYYGWTVLWTHLANFRLAIQLNETRDYFVNMAGMDMPIKTKREINYFLGEHMGKSFLYEHCSYPAYRLSWGDWAWAESPSKVVQINENSRIRPPNLNLRWGQHYVILHRDAVEWMFSSVEIRHFLGWLVNTKSPDEMFYATMLYNSPFHSPERLFTHNNFKYASWEQCCSGYELSDGHPCVLGVCDMGKLSSVNHLWVTKVDNNVDPELIPAIHKLLGERTEEETKTGRVNRIPIFPGQILDPPYIEIQPNGQM